MSGEIIKSPVTFDNSVTPSLNYICFRLRIKFDGQHLKQDKVTFNHKFLVNIYIDCEIDLLPFQEFVDFMLGNSLLGAVNLIKKADFERYRYLGYGTGSDARGMCSVK